MSTPRPRLRRYVLLLLVALLAPLAVAQDAEDPEKKEPPKQLGDREDQGLGREQMWYAPTAEDWKKPCLIQWQRSWADAQAVAKETGKAILICVNMDGEIASEHYAGIRYRQPEIAELYEQYVCVIASTYRHTPRDHDDEGNRILCPRFGSVTCGEHIAIEPILFAKYFDGQRVAPRHIMIELDGSEQYDVFFTWDTASVFDSVRKGIEERAVTPRPIVRGDRTIVERVASRDIRDREAVEGAYRKGDAKLRQALLDAALKQGGDAPLDLLRLAVFGLDTDLAKVARQGLAGSDSPDATDLIDEALRVPMDESERAALVAALTRLGKTSSRAQWLSVVHRGLGSSSTTVDARAWARAQEEYEASAAARDLLELDARHAEKIGAAEKAPDDPAACLELAEASLDLAMRARRSNVHGRRVSRAYTRHLLEEARRVGLKAETLGADAWRTNATIALASYYGGDVETARTRAVAAVKDMPGGEASWRSMVVLTLFAEARWEAIKAAMAANERVNPDWVTDVNTTYTILRKHPHGSAEQIVWHLEFLKWLGARRQLSRVLREGLERFPHAAILHRRYRSRVRMTRGIDALEPAYERLLGSLETTPRLRWYAGYASVETAEWQRRARRPDRALAAYGRGIEHYEKASVEDPGLRESVNYRVALALAGRARVAMEAGDVESALADTLASLERRPGSAGTKDGLGITPADTATMLLARLVELKRDGEAARLREAIGELDPELLPRD
jgi:hypothetical protein